MCRSDDFPPYETINEMISRMYPTLNPIGHANYVALVKRVASDDFKAELEARKADGRCLIQPRIGEGEPWKGDCLTHGVPDSMEHHFTVNPNAYND